MLYRGFIERNGAHFYVELCLALAQYETRLEDFLGG